MVIKLGPLLLESSSKISKLHFPTNPEHKCKAKIENWLAIGFELGALWLGTRSYNNWLGTCWVRVPLLPTHCLTNNGVSLNKKLYTHILSLETTLEKFHIPETVPVFSNLIPITKSNINLQ